MLFIDSLGLTVVDKIKKHLLGLTQLSIFECVSPFVQVFLHFINNQHLLQALLGEASTFPTIA